MALSNHEISENYQRCLELIADILNHKLSLNGHQLDHHHPDFTEIVYSVAGHEQVVIILQSVKFDRSKYKPAITAAIEEVRKRLFPDVAKKRFVSVDTIDCDAFMPEELKTYPQSDAENIISNDTFINILAKYFNPEISDYLQNKLLQHNPDLLPLINISDPRLLKKKNILAQVNFKIALLKKFYPEGNIDFTCQLDFSREQEENSIIHTYLNIYLGIERHFPSCFLKVNAERRAAILTRFLIEDILDTTPQKILKRKDETFFIKQKLQNVYRLFNYSYNRVLGNAYPDLIPPWLDSRTNGEYWDNTQNRINAVRWLVQHKLKISPHDLGKNQISRKDFSRNGLSYMFNQFYNSVSRALQEAYPELQPWQIGNVASEYWSDDNIKEAIKWMISKKNWKLVELPARIRCGDLTRQTFSECGLATIFEKKFSKNIYKAINFSFPGQFEPWEFGKVPSEFWDTSVNIYRASKWIAEQEGLHEDNIIPAIRRKKFTIKNLQNYSIGQALKKICEGKIEKLFESLYFREFMTFIEEQKILRKIKSQTKATSFSAVIDTFFNGFFAGYNSINKQQRNMRHYQRILRRINNNLE